MRPKLLFTIGSLDYGGVAKSLLSLLSVIDKEKYSVSLLIAGRDYGYNKNVPKEIHIFSNNRLTNLVEGKRGIFKLIKKGDLLLAIASFFRMLLSYINKGWAGWWLSRIMPVITYDEYDLIVDYNGQHMLYYMVDRLKGHKKVTFFHSDYKNWRFYENLDRRYFPKVDKIFTISNICVKSIKEIFPNVAEKVCLMENITSPKYIQKLSYAPIKWQKKNKYVFISLGHVCIGKGSDIALEVAELLKEKKIDFEWLFLGSLSNDLDYINIVEKKGLSNYISYCGNVNNPYPYIRKADIFIHLSRYEGKSIALDEAKILCKPIVVTNFSSVTDQFTDGVNASICEMNAASATNKILELLDNSNLQKKYIEKLLTNCHDNSNEIEKIYKLI